jgi:AcrR family transcriptional regulator
MAERSTNVVRKPRRRRDPEGTRELILEAARGVLAQDGKEGLSVAQVAQIAGVNRGTAYQHFQTREQLIEATAEWVSEKLYQSTFSDPAIDADSPGSIGVAKVITELSEFAMENPELGRVWLYELLSSKRPAGDKFWRQYKENMERFAQSEYARSGIDVEVHSVVMLAGTFLWPVWVRAHARTNKERKEMTDRFAREMLRLALQGTLRPEKFPDLDARFGGKKRK